MNLTVYYEGQFWVGVIEFHKNERLKVYRYVFGPEPSDAVVLNFVNQRLLTVINNHSKAGVKDKQKLDKKMNPKRLQRQAAKEMEHIGISTKAQEAMKEAIKQHKLDSKRLKRERNDALKQRKWELKKQKAKEKHKGR